MPDPFEGPYNGTLHMLIETSMGPSYAIGGKDRLKDFAESGILRAVMLTKAQEGTTWMPTRQPNVSLQEVIDLLPGEMLFGSIAWLDLKGEASDDPSTVIIHSGIELEELRTLVFARLYTSLRGKKDFNESLKKLRDKAYINEEILKGSMPVVSVLKGEDN